MNFLDQESTLLSGVYVEALAGSTSTYDITLFGTTDSICIVGTAFNGPVGKPVKVYSPDHARYMFGPVYDSKTRRQASLVASIQDAWDTGARTIYAVRLSGKEIYKDYQLLSDTNLKLRVAGMFPSNLNKEISMVFNDNHYDMNIKIYKPAERATISEKAKGLVSDQEGILVNKIDLYANGLTKENDLTELISMVNGFAYNTVLKLSIVDEKGNDVTLSSSEAKSLKIGDMFPGLYTVGREANVEGIIAETKMHLILDKKPYDSYEGNFYKELTLNTNVAIDLPVYSANSDINTVLDLNSLGEFDFLETAGMLDSIFKKDTVDYEEVDISDFEKYKRLGSGFAINAEAIVLGEGESRKVKVKEVSNKDQKISAIQDGILSTLENLDARYRVLADIAADTKIKGKLPKAKEFKYSKAKEVKMFGGALEIKAEVKDTDFSEAKKYKIEFKHLDSTVPEDLAVITKASGVKANLYSARTARLATKISYAEMLANKKEYKEGSLFLVDEVVDAKYAESVKLLYSYTNGKFVSLHKFSTGGTKDLLKDSLVIADGVLYVCNTPTSAVDGTGSHTVFVGAKAVDVDSKGFAICELSNGTFVIAELTAATIDDSLIAETGVLLTSVIGTVETVFKDAEDGDIMFIALTDSYNENKVTIMSNQFDFLTIDEVATILNEDKDFAKLFVANILDITAAQEYIEDIKDLPGIQLTADLTDREVDYNTSLRIPFRTEDNFARQFAQHCYVTSLKNRSTHGVMGVSLLLDLGLNSINNKVQTLIEQGVDATLVGKKDNGVNILNRDNLPVQLGRKLSVVVGQYAIKTSDNYTYISNFAPGYAGMVSNLSLEKSSTLQPISIPSPMYALKAHQLSSLTNAGFVTLKESFTNGWVITDGITMDSSDSAHKRLSASRISDEVETIIRNAAEPFIGTQNSLASQTSLRSAIKSALDKIVGTLLESYDFKLVISKSDAQLGIIKIPTKIVAIREIKAIISEITVTDQ